jgi:hypothetical protein
MIKFRDQTGNIIPLKRIYVGNKSIAAVYYRGKKIWPIGDAYSIILSCYYNGYWIDEYPWTDETPWNDET